MASFYATIKSRFDADGTLVPSPFNELFMGDAPKDEDYPFCVLVPNEETKLSRSFGGSKFHEEAFAFHVVARTQEAVETYADLVEAAFNDCEIELSVTGLTVIRLDKESRRYEQDEKDVWECVVEYVTEFEEAA